MSVGVVVAGDGSFEPLDGRYYVLTPYKNHGGMYSHALYVDGVRPWAECSRERAMGDLRGFLAAHGVERMFAYNAGFDYRHLPELRHLEWYDIMRLAAYRQHNHGIPAGAECYGTGRLKRGYGVEAIYRLLSGDAGYRELHNAFTDAMDELGIMRLLGHGLERYVRL
jgi:hypothetical protein